MSEAVTLAQQRSSNTPPPVRASDSSDKTFSQTRRKPVVLIVPKKPMGVLN